MLLLKIVSDLGLNFCQEIWRTWDFTMLANLQIRMEQFYRYWQKIEHRKQHELHVNIPFLCPPSPVGQHRVSQANVWCGLHAVGLLLGKECQAQETPCCHNRQQANLSNFCPRGRPYSFYIGQKTNLFSASKTILCAKTVYYKNVLEKHGLEQKLSGPLVRWCTETWRTNGKLSSNCFFDITERETH